MRIGLGTDVHAFAPHRKLVLGGVLIPHSQGLLGHSDADVLTHALCDAFLGALALGDLGHFFPDTDPQFEGVDSLQLLRTVYDRVLEQGWQLSNADTVVLAERPKLSPHLPAMRESLAGCLQESPSRISIKATTTERLGFIGNEEGIAAQAIVLLHQTV